MQLKLKEQAKSVFLKLSEMDSFAGYESRPLNYFKQFGAKREIIFDASVPGDQVTRYNFELSANLPIFKEGSVHFINEKAEFEVIKDFAKVQNKEKKFLNSSSDFRLKVNMLKFRLT